MIEKSFLEAVTETQKVVNRFSRTSNSVRVKKVPFLTVLLYVVNMWQLCGSYALSYGNFS